ncbi:MAG: hypothetical protein LAO20_04355 [Acidobacteriia bacterium]|nr:hypothetical protein [Terriglobia bacterium]
MEQHNTQTVARQLHFKDAHLDELAERANVAQFISFDPSRRQRYARVLGFPPNHIFSSVPDAVKTLLERSPEKRINIRSFRPEEPQGHEFLYGIKSNDEATAQIERLTALNLWVIANETVDVDDGGVSGVAHGDVIEFAPRDTPRVVETENVLSADRRLGTGIIELVYGFEPLLPEEDQLRVEFSIHPIRRGYRHQHTIIWEIQDTIPVKYKPVLRWPNAFSEFIGDKAFGLLVANCIGLCVPRAMVLSRVLRPFVFGRRTGSDVVWLRTSPKLPEPGFFPTVRGWTDPFAFLEQVPGNERVASIIAQDEVAATYSGAVLTRADGDPIVEGVPGFGDDLMLGRRQPESLPNKVVELVTDVHSRLAKQVGSIRAEWAFDGLDLWILQLQPEKAVSKGSIIFPGDVKAEMDFDVRAGLSGLRELIGLMEGKNVGIRVVGQVGMTSHIADVLRRNRIPSRIVPR